MEGGGSEQCDLCTWHTNKQIAMCMRCVHVAYKPIRCDVYTMSARDVETNALRCVYNAYNG